MTIYSTTRNLSSQISTNVSLSHVRTMEHAKTKPAATCVTVKQASADSTVKAVSKLKSSFRKMQACKRVDPFKFPMRFEAWFQFCSQWCWQQMYLILCHSAESLLLSHFRSHSQTRGLSSQILTNVSPNHVRTMEPAPPLSTITNVTVLQASTAPTVQSVSRHRFEFHVKGQRLSMPTRDLVHGKQW